MTCSLSRTGTYDLSQVTINRSDGAVTVKIVNPPASCVDGAFSSHKATIEVDTHLQGAKLTYTDHPVILVPNQAYANVVGSESHWGLVCGLLLLVTAVAAFWYRKAIGTFVASAMPSSDVADQVPPSQYNRPVQQGSYPPSYPPTATERRFAGRSYSRQTTVAVPTSTIVHTGNSGSDMLAGMLIGNALSNHESNPPREVIHDEPAPSVDYSSDSSPSYSSDSGSSYSSDSSSSYSSDSSSSFSSDSGSSFSSDSGSSFSSD